MVLTTFPASFYFKNLKRSLTPNTLMLSAKEEVENRATQDTF